MIDLNSKQKVEIHLDSDMKSHPRCEHGPTILFSRGNKKFYACAAFRDRKDCDFYLDHEKKLNQQKMAIVKEKTHKLLELNNYSKSAKVLSELRKGQSSSVHFCCNCSRVEEDKCKENEHNIATLSKEDLQSPVRILNPKSKNKKEAQYFFSDKTTNFLADLIQRLKFTHILCIGCPSVFEKLPSSLENTSLLLDIDARFRNFYTHQRFVWTNVFNNHFFEGEIGSSVVQNFLIGCDKLLLIIDPPFGAKTELISHSLRRIKNQLDMLSMSGTVSTIWVYPYFMERQVLAGDPDMAMSDYRVSYSDHVQYGETEQARKQGSPVRLFTDILLGRVKLPAPEYYHCEACQQWRHVSNQHCATCGTCPSKDGRSYVHCGQCSRCVKPTYKHCDQCNRCALETHQCGNKPNTKLLKSSLPSKRKPFKQHRKGHKNKRIKSK